MSIEFTIRNLEQAVAFLKTREALSFSNITKSLIKIESTVEFISDLPVHPTINSYFYVTQGSAANPFDYSHLFIYTVTEDLGETYIDLGEISKGEKGNTGSTPRLLAIQETVLNTSTLSNYSEGDYVIVTREISNDSVYYVVINGAFVLVPGTFPLVRGFQGIQGIQGIRGIQGPTGPAGLNGEKGNKGDVGDRGEPGGLVKYFFENEQAMINAHIEENVYLAVANNEPTPDLPEAWIVYVWLGTDTGTIEDYENLGGFNIATGVKGDRGEPGETGATGPTGVQGEAGRDGLDGDATQWRGFYTSLAELNATQPASNLPDYCYALVKDVNGSFSNLYHTENSIWLLGDLVIDLTSMNARITANTNQVAVNKTDIAALKTKLSSNSFEYTGTNLSDVAVYNFCITCKNKITRGKVNGSFYLWLENGLKTNTPAFRNTITGGSPSYWYNGTDLMFVENQGDTDYKITITRNSTGGVCERFFGEWRGTNFSGWVEDRTYLQNSVDTNTTNAVTPNAVKTAIDNSVTTEKARVMSGYTSNNSTTLTLDCNMDGRTVRLECLQAGTWDKRIHWIKVGDVFQIQISARRSAENNPIQIKVWRYSGWKSGNGGTITTFVGTLVDNSFSTGIIDVQHFYFTSNSGAFGANASLMLIDN